MRVPAEGEVCIAGPTVMKGYLPSGMEDPIVDGWLRTGDLGRFDDEGYLTITGRIKDVIMRGGEGLSPQQIETVLNCHPAVAASCVVSQPDAELGEVPVAFVASRQRGPVTQDVLQRWVSMRLSHIYVPVRVEFIGFPPGEFYRQGRSDCIEIAGGACVRLFGALIYGGVVGIGLKQPATR